MGRCRGLNPGPHTCKACALPLSYIPLPAIRYSWNEDIGNRIFSSFPNVAFVLDTQNSVRECLYQFKIGPHPAEPASQGRPALSGWRWWCGIDVAAEEWYFFMSPAGQKQVSCILVSIVVSIPACHAGGRGSIPRRGGC